MRPLLVVVALWLALGAVGAGEARASYGDGATIVSADPVRDEQGDDASTYATVSADGRFAAFSTRARNFFADDDPDPLAAYRVGGIFRKDLGSGALALVAGGDVRAEADDALLSRGAQAPSLSTTGRYVAFSTAAALLPGDRNDAVDVYVRDMTLAPSAPGAYDLVSAIDGTGDAATYAKPVPDRPGLDPGAELTRGGAISGDGRYVVFRTLADSDLVPGGAPAFQVWVRDRQLRSTTLVTRRAGGTLPAGGATGPAVISQDASTVAWTGQDAPAQTAYLPGEIKDDSAFFYLWRRVVDGPSAPTRRVTGAADLDDPACAPGTRVTLDPTAAGPCYGPLTGPEDGQASIGALPPALSADGRTVAFLTGAGPRPLTSTGGSLDLYLTSMAPGTSRKAGTRELTREGTGNQDASYPIDGLVLSGDAKHIALSTERTTFVLPGLRQLGAPRALADHRDVYLIDLRAATVERVTRAADGSDSQGDVASQPALSADGSVVAFTSPAADLFYGDANGVADAFVASRQAPIAARPPRTVAPAPHVVTPSIPPPALRLTLSVRKLGRRGVALIVGVPGAGVVRASGRGLRGARMRARARMRISLHLRARRAGKVKIVVTFTPAAGGRAIVRKLTVKFPRR